MQALILAGGEGSRMRSVTAHVPKALLYLPGGTLLEHQLALLAKLRVSRTFVVIHHQAQQMDLALDGLEKVSFVRQRPPLTLLGALASAEEHVTEQCIVLHGDNYYSHGLEYLLGEAQIRAQGVRSDALFLLESQIDESDRAVRLASTGCYVLSPEIFPTIKSLHGDALSTLTAALLNDGAIVKEVPLVGWRKNINHVEDLLWVSRRMLEEWKGSFHPRDADQGYNAFEACPTGELPVWISKASEVVDSDIGSHVVVGPGARVRDCMLREVIVFPDAELAGQRLERAVVVPTRLDCALSTP